MQLIPVCIGLSYFTHPSAVWSGRAWMTLILLLAWAARLMHNYVRRERWVFGHREDWRFSDMREKFGGWWWFISFFAVSGAQHPMLVGMTLPLAVTMLDPNPSPLGLTDAVALTVCCCGLTVGAIADNQLWAFMNRPDKSTRLLLDTGLWRFSRHPNHFGEQLWWVGLALFAVGQGQWWALAGVAFNHPLDTFVTLPLIEERMLKRRERRALYAAYQERTSLIVPMPVAKAHAL